MIPLIPPVVASDPAAEFCPFHITFFNLCQAYVATTEIIKNNILYNPSVREGFILKKGKNFLLSRPPPT